MKLLKLEIVNFGKLHNHTVDLRDGLNVFCEENGYGKTTLAMFIKAMLYGLPSNRSQSLDKNERKRFMPWQGGDFGGSLEFASEKGKFRIERFFGAKESADEFRLFDLSTNKPSHAYSEQVGIELFGIDAEGFERSTFLSQNGIDDHGTNGSVTAKLTGLLEEVNDMGSFDVAMDELTKRRKYYELKGNKGRVAELTALLTEEQAECQRCRELLPLQEQREARLTAKAKEIREAEELLKKSNEWLRLATARELHLRECRAAERKIEEWETERKAILNAFRDRALPTDEELEATRSLLNEFRVTQAKAESLTLTPEESDRLAQLKKSYPMGLPTSATLAGLQAEYSRETALRAKLEANIETVESRDLARFADTGIPDSAILDGVTEQLDRSEAIQKRLVALSKEPRRKPTRRIPLAVALAVLLVGLVCGGLSFGMPSLQIPLLIAGGTITIVGILLLVLGGNGNAKRAAIQRQEEIEQLHMEQEHALGSVRALLQQYACLPANGNYRGALTDLSYAAKNASEHQRKYAAQQKLCHDLQEGINACHEKLADTFQRLGTSTYPEDPQGLLNRMYSDTREWSALTEKQKQLSEQQAVLRGELREKQGALIAFFDRLVEKDSKNPESCLAQAETLCRRHAALLGNQREKAEDLKQRRESYASDAPASLPDQQELERQTAELEIRLTTLREEHTALQREFNRTVEETRKIPDTEDRVANLTAERQIATENLRIIKLTEQFLTDSKEALSTRYLGGMQEHFTRLCGSIEADSFADSRIDTSFEISVRENGKSRDLEYFSRGYRDYLQFCARISLTRAMFSEGEQPFLLLDDPFVHLDERNLGAVRELLEQLSEDYQILYFVCSDSRA